MQLMILVEYLQHSSLKFHTKENDMLVGMKVTKITNVLQDNGLWSESALNYRTIGERHSNPDGVVGSSTRGCEIFSLLAHGKTNQVVGHMRIMCSKQEKKKIMAWDTWCLCKPMRCGWKDSSLNKSLTRLRVDFSH